jgi:hypothetical protein
MRVDHTLRPGFLASAHTTDDAGCGCGQQADIGAGADNLDERTVSYILASRPHFEELRQATGQLAGMLALAAAGASSVTPDHPLFVTAREAHRRAGDGIRAARAGGRAEHHHRHLAAAVELLGIALERAQRDLHRHAAEKERIDPVLEPLTLAYRHLAWAGRALPGFEIVGFGQACCAPVRQASAQ